MQKYAKKYVTLIITHKHFSYFVITESLIQPVYAGGCTGLPTNNETVIDELISYIFRTVVFEVSSFLSNPALTILQFIFKYQSLKFMNTFLFWI